MKGSGQRRYKNPGRKKLTGGVMLGEEIVMAVLVMSMNGNGGGGEGRREEM